jgi:multidrug resistance protein MdtO
MNPGAASSPVTIWQKVWRELQPAPGRLNVTLRIVLSVVITVILLLVLQLPFGSIGLYLVFFVARDSPSVSFKSTVALLLALAAATTVEFAVVILTDNDPIARVLSVVVVTFVAGVVLVATTVPALGTVFGLIYCTLIGLWENHLPADRLVKTSLYLIATAALSMGTAVAVEYVFGAKDPVKELEKERRNRYQAVENFFSLCAQGVPAAQIVAAGTRVSQLAAAGQSTMLKLYDTIVDRNLETGNLPIGSRVRITMLAQLLEVSAACASQHIVDGTSIAGDAETRERCRKIAEACHGLLPGLANSRAKYQRIGKDEPVTLLDRVEAMVDTIYSMPEDTGDLTADQELVALPAKKVPLLVRGALQDPNTAAFGLKISLCATLCYVIYHAVDYPGIATSVTTVLITGLSTSAATNQKLILRFVGSLIGGLLLGIGATSFLFPHMDTITALVILIIFVTLISAWCAAGPQFGYVGLQMAFSFYIVALEGPSAPTELAPARDRLVGILLALVIMWFVFDQLWPVRAVTAMRRKLAFVLRSEASLLMTSESTEPVAVRISRIDALRDSVGKAISELRKLNEIVEYDYGVDRAQQQQSGNTILRAALTAVAIFWNQLAVLQSPRDHDFLTEPGLIQVRHTIAEKMTVMADAVVTHSPFPVVDPETLLEPGVLSNPRYAEHARNYSDRYGELQDLVSTLKVQA